MPVTYAALTARDRDWGLDDFVAEVNAMLPEVVPGDAAARGKLAINPRLVRHYTTEGVLPKPLKEGVEARYDGDHLVRVLALRRLLAEGYPSALAGQFLQRHDRERLARFLLGELRPDLDLAPGGPVVVAAAATERRRARAPRGDARAGGPAAAAAEAPPEPSGRPAVGSGGRRTPQRTPRRTPAKRANRGHARPECCTRRAAAGERRTTTRASRTTAPSPAGTRPARSRRPRRRLDPLPAAERPRAPRARRLRRPHHPGRLERAARRPAGAARGDRPGAHQRRR
jgi:DNA-binding transcriptional MerR regulator